MAEPQLPTATIATTVLVEPIHEEEPFPTLPPANPGADSQPKRKGRPRLMRGLSRMSSFPNLNQFGRSRASSTPYDRSGATMSCTSLAPPSGSAFLASPSASRSDEQSSSLPMPVSLSSPCTRIDGNAYGSNSDGSFVRQVASAPLYSARWKRSFVDLWASLPREIKIYIFAHFGPKELVRLSRVSREFSAICFDGQLWTSFDATGFYRDIPSEYLAKIATSAGPFIRELNLRGCIQIRKCDDALKLSGACQNLVSTCLEGSHINAQSLRTLLGQNPRLVNINLSGLDSVDESICLTIAEKCQQLEVLNLSWCKNVKAKNLNPIIVSCTKLRDLRTRELRSVDTDLSFANTLFETNRLERLILSGSLMVTNNVLTALMRGPNPPDYDRPADNPGVPPRRLRHLDLGQCRRLTQAGLVSLGYCVPDLEGFVLSGCPSMTNAGLIPFLASCPKLTHLELEDLTELTDELLTNHLAKAPCVTSLKHLSLSYCEKIGDEGVLSVLRACKLLRSLEIDNTQVTDDFLDKATDIVNARSPIVPGHAVRPYSGLYLAVYDCPNISWEGVELVLLNNHLMDDKRGDEYWYRSEMVTLKCFYGWQMTVDEHTKRVERRDFEAARRLAHKWQQYMRTIEDGDMADIGRRHRRRIRVAHNAELAGNPGGLPLISRRRARTASCAVM